MRQHLVWKLAFSFRGSIRFVSLYLRNDAARRIVFTREKKRWNAITMADDRWQRRKEKQALWRSPSSPFPLSSVCLRIIRRRGAPLYRESANRAALQTGEFWGVTRKIYTTLISETCKLLSWVMGSFLFSPHLSFVISWKFYSIIPITGWNKYVLERVIEFEIVELFFFVFV